MNINQRTESILFTGHEGFYTEAFSSSREVFKITKGL